MKMNTEVIVHAVKQSEGAVDGNQFSSTTFHCEVDLPDNSVGKSIGRVTRPFKCGKADEFEKWAHLGNALPIKAKAVFEMQAGGRDARGGETTKLTMVEIVPVLDGKTINAPAKQ